MEPSYITRVRKKIGLSQEELAKVLSVSFVTVNNWERGRTKPKIKNQREIFNMEKQANGFEKNDEVTFRPIQYLGSKMRLVDQIEKMVKGELTDSNATFCDLFAGSGVVSNKLARSFRVKSCDIQEYSGVITRALFTKTSLGEEEVNSFLESCIKSKYYLTLMEKLSELIEFEKKSLTMAAVGEPEMLMEFYQNISLYTQKFDEINTDKKSQLFSMKKRYLDCSGDQDAHITLIYGGVYFSIAQAVFMDTVLYKLRGANISDSDKNFYKAVLLSTASEIVNTVGKQFAQPMKLLDRSGKPKKLLIERTIRDRNYNPVAIFKKYSKEYLMSVEKIIQKDHKFYKMDFSDFLENHAQDVKCFYADPPYTIDHYSRFYHVLETIAKGDLPDLAKMNKKGVSVIMNGMYRDDRHQSPFCIPSEVSGAFENMIKGCSRHGASLIISYSPYDEANDDRPRLLKTNEILGMAKKYYSDVEIVDVPNHAHRKLHSVTKNITALQSGEVFIKCSNRIQ